jgi:LPS-assembly lipoprotein
MSARALIAVVAALALPASLTGLAGCGFTPMYAQPGVAGNIRHIQVVAPTGREGFLLRQSLDDDFGYDKGDDPTYRLEMELTPYRQAHGVEANATAQRYELDLKVTYKLIEISSEKVVRTGTVISNISYDSADQPYAGIMARQDVQNRLASDAAQKIEVQIAAWLARQPG